jgi:acetyl esterase/lipase
VPTPVPGPLPPLDPETKAALDCLPPAPPLTAEGIPRRRGERGVLPRLTNAQLTRGGRHTVEERSVPAREGSPEVPLIICRPTTIHTTVPLLYFIHGGGMIMGTARDGIGEALDLAEEVGAALISVEYRLAPETPHPGPVEDCYAGLAWAVEHAAELGVDPARVVVGGASAGGGLAAAVALLARDRGGPGLLGQLLVYPMIDDRNDTPSAHQMATAPIWDQATNEVGWTALLGAARGGPDVSPYAAPARAANLAGLPPAYIDVGSVDTFRSEDIDYAERLWEAGGVAELHVWPGGSHGFDVFAPDSYLTRAAINARSAWLRRVLPAR